jgi:hypothetical protein
MRWEVRKTERGDQINFKRAFKWLGKEIILL